MLAWLLASLFLLTAASTLIVVLVNSPGSVRRDDYVPFILLLDLFLVAAYGLNAARGAAIG
jgi:hypothetical protein